MEPRTATDWLRNGPSLAYPEWDEDEPRLAPEAANYLILKRGRRYHIRIPILRGRLPYKVGFAGLPPGMQQSNENQDYYLGKPIENGFFECRVIVWNDLSASAETFAIRVTDPEETENVIEPAEAESEILPSIPEGAEETKDEEQEETFSLEEPPLPPEPPAAPKARAATKRTLNEMIAESGRFRSVTRKSCDPLQRIMPLPLEMKRMLYEPLKTNVKHEFKPTNKHFHRLAEIKAKDSKLEFTDFLKALEIYTLGNAEDYQFDERWQLRGKDYRAAASSFYTQYAQYERFVKTRDALAEYYTEVSKGLDDDREMKTTWFDDNYDEKPSTSVIASIINHDADMLSITLHEPVRKKAAWQLVEFFAGCETYIGALYETLLAAATKPIHPFGMSLRATLLNDAWIMSFIVRLLDLKRFEDFLPPAPDFELPSNAKAFPHIVAPEFASLISAKDLTISKQGVQLLIMAPWLSCVENRAYHKMIAAKKDAKDGSIRAQTQAISFQIAMLRIQIASHWRRRQIEWTRLGTEFNESIELPVTCDVPEDLGKKLALLIKDIDEGKNYAPEGTGKAPEVHVPMPAEGSAALPRPVPVPNVPRSPPASRMAEGVPPAPSTSSGTTNPSSGSTVATTTPASTNVPFAVQSGPGDRAGDIERKEFKNAADEREYELRLRVRKRGTSHPERPITKSRKEPESMAESPPSTQENPEENERRRQEAIAYGAKLLARAEQNNLESDRFVYPGMTQTDLDHAQQLIRESLLTPSSSSGSFDSPPFAGVAGPLQPNETFVVVPPSTQPTVVTVTHPGLADLAADEEADIAAEREIQREQHQEEEPTPVLSAPSRLTPLEKKRLAEQEREVEEMKKKGKRPKGG